MNRQYFNSQDLSSNGEQVYFDRNSVGAARIVTPLNRDIHHSFDAADNRRFRVVIRKKSGGNLNKTVFALSLLAVAILGCIAGTLLHFSGGSKTSGSRYTNNAELQTATLLKAPTSAPIAAPETRIKPAPLAAEQSLRAQVQTVNVNYKPLPRTAKNVESAPVSSFENTADSANDVSAENRAVGEIRNEMRRRLNKNQTAEIKTAEQLGNEVRNWLEPDKKQKK